MTQTVARQRLVEVAQARQQGIGSLLYRTAVRHPDRTALVWRGRRDSYAELNAAVNSAAAALSARGVSVGDRIVLLSHNCREFAVLYFALAKLGAISVPVNFMLTAPEVAFIVDHAEATGFIVEDALLPVAIDALATSAQGDDCRLRAVIPLQAGAPPPGWDDVAQWLDDPGAPEPEVLIADDAPIQLMYTSGTESRPKGATMTSRSLVAQYVSVIVDGSMTEDDVEIHALPFYHCAQLHCFLTPDVYLGATSVVLERPDPAAILAAIEAERVTKLFAPPTVWISLLRHPDFDTRDLSSLRKGYYGAAAMPVEVLRELGERLPQAGFWNFYGQTEMAPLATVLKPADQVRKAGSAGRACLNVETRLVDDDGRPVTPGEVGEIVHRSPQAMTGYWRDPEKTAEAFRDGWFHSGDLGIMDSEGYLSVVDRKKDMIKSGGENVASREVEEVLFLHPSVAEAAVFGIPDPYWIEAVAAAVVARPDSTLTSADVIAHARAHLAGFKVPKVVVVLEALPKNPSGKILKRELRASFAAAADTAATGQARSTATTTPGSDDAAAEPYPGASPKGKTPPSAATSQ